MPAEDVVEKVGDVDNPSEASDEVKLWRKRKNVALNAYEEWEKDGQVKRSYNYWRGKQRENATDHLGQQRAIVNKIHADVANRQPALYFYRPYARITPQPELVDTPGSSIEENTTLLQDTVNHLIRIPTTKFDMSTRCAVLEAEWAMGCVEVGYDVDFMESPAAPKPPLKEDEKTKSTESPELRAPEEEQAETPESEDDKLEREIQELRQSVKKEQFFVKHIPANQVMIASSDKPHLLDNDWVGYWEDVNVEDVKRSPAYGPKAKNLKPRTGKDEDTPYTKEDDDEGESEIKKIRLYKFWDLRSNEKIVMAEGHPIFLFRKEFKRCPLKFMRYDIDPYHFYPMPPLMHKLGPQDEYNHSREYLRRVRNGTVPLYTYDEDAIEAEDMKKLEKGVMGAYIKRKAGTPGQDVISPVNQPSLSENAMNTLTISEKEFADVGSVGGDGRVPQSKTATQAKIAESKDQAQDNFARVQVATFLAEVSKELLMSAIDNMILDQWVGINVEPDALYADIASQQVQQQYRQITSQKLRQASQGIEWDLDVDVESLSPVSEEEKFQKWMQGLSFIGNPGMAMVFAASPDLLKHTLTLMGMKSSKEQEMIVQGLAAVAQQQQAAQQPGQGSPPNPRGASPQPGGAQPGQPAPGGPQPGGPVGPGASPPA